MFRKISRFFAVAAAAVILTACGGDNSPSVEEIESQINAHPEAYIAYDHKKVEVYGDSIMIGVGVPYASPFMRMAEYRPNWELTHRAAGGLSLKEIIEGYFEPFPYAAPIYYPAGPQRPFGEIQREANIVVIQAGINDSIADSTPEGAALYEHDLRYTVRMLLEEGRIPVLTGLPNIGESTTVVHDLYNEAGHRIAAEFDLEHAGWDKAYGPEGVGVDGLHPSQRSSDILTAMLILAIERADERASKRMTMTTFKR